MSAPQGREPQWSPDGERWWDGHQWIPAAQARAQAARVAAVEDHQPAYLPALDRSGRSRLVKRLVGGVLLLVMGFALAAALTSHRTPTPAAAQVHTDTVVQTLQAAVVAEKRHFAAHRRFTPRLDVLNDDGYHPLQGVTLTIVRATTRTFCLQASQGATTRYATSHGLTERTCA